MGRGSSCRPDHPIETMVSASWNDHTCQTAMLDSCIDRRYCIVEDETGITISEDGSAQDGCRFVFESRK